VAVWVICAEDDEEARRLAASGRMAFTMLRRGQLIAVPPVEQALRFLESERRRREESGGAEQGGGDAAPRSERRTVVGAPETVREQLQEVVASYGAEEAIVVCITYEHEARRRSYELLAEVFGLPR
jgi:alkanesulfonate monooxygenase SsuD/methylene tetrahydromethanopterin reductase-like flavin-dependent oxidoreductase (luciferase family)